MKDKYEHSLCRARDDVERSIEFIVAAKDSRLAIYGAIEALRNAMNYLREAERIDLDHRVTDK